MCLSLSFLSGCCNKMHWQNQLRGQRVYLSSQVQVTVHQDPRNLEWSHDIHSPEHSNEVMHACMPVLSRRALSALTGPRIPSLENRATHSGWIFPPQPMESRWSPIHLPTSQSDLNNPDKPSPRLHQGLTMYQAVKTNHDSLLSFQWTAKF